MNLTTKDLETIERCELEKLIRSGALERTVPRISAMNGCEQSPLNHAEGDTATHTSFVVMYAQQIACTISGMSEDERACLLWASLLHDWGKPFTRVIGERGVSFPGHEEFVGSRVWMLLSSSGFTLPVKETISWMVTMHGFAGSYPKLTAEQRIRLYRAPGLELLLQLHEADHLSCFTPPFPNGGHLPVFSEQIRCDANRWRESCTDIK